MLDYKMTASLAITLQAYVLIMMSSSKEQRGHALLMELAKASINITIMLAVRGLFTSD